MAIEYVDLKFKVSSSGCRIFTYVPMVDTLCITYMIESPLSGSIDQRNLLGNMYVVADIFRLHASY